jgi:hypothetical protein
VLQIDEWGSAEESDLLPVVVGLVVAAFAPQLSLGTFHEVEALALLLLLGRVILHCGLV